MPLILYRGGCRISVGELREKIPAQDLRSIFAKLKIRIEKRFGAPVIVQLYDTDGGDVILPRRCIIDLRKYGIQIDNRLAIGARATAEFTEELTANQHAAAERLMEIFTPTRAAEGTACALLDMPPGQGKTILAAYIINNIGLHALYVVHRRSLARQTAEEFAKVGMRAAIWPDRAATTIIVINSIGLPQDDFWRNIGTVIIDEIHLYTSAKRRCVFRCAMARYMLGMSGTVCDRPDKPEDVYVKELCLEAECSPVISVNLPNWIPDDLHFDCTVRAIKYHARDEYARDIVHDSTGALFTPWMIKQFLADPDRQALILSEVRRLLAGPHTGVFVFCFECEALSIMRDVLAAENPYAPELSSVLIGGTRNIDAALNSRLILTTYAYSSTGISIQRMTAMILATPMRNGTEQVVKRIMRRGGDVGIRREVVDIIDSRTRLRGQFNTRRSVYERNGFDIEYIERHAPFETDDAKIQNGN